MLLGAACAVLIIGPARAGIVQQGPSLNGFSLNGFSLNGVMLSGVSPKGASLQGAKVDGLCPRPVGVNVGDHGGVGINGKVIAIEF
jgi:hypothetical protein